MSHYYESEKCRTNARIAAEKGRVVQKQKLLEKIAKYNASPKLCERCSTPIDYKKRENRYCSHTCAAIVRNTGRVPDAAHRNKTSKKLKGRPSLFKGSASNRDYGLLPTNKTSKIQWCSCVCCHMPFYVRGWSKHDVKKTCGIKACRTHASVGRRVYPNGRKKLFRYFNKHQNKEVILESSWEHQLAIWLDERNVKWVRPPYIKWFDERSQSDRLYYPDFYLPDYDKYLVPKNVWVMSQEDSQYKMNKVKALIPLIYGELSYLQEVVEGLTNKAP